MKIIVTGAEGFIGASLVKYFRGKGDIVQAWNRRENEKKSEDIFTVDLTDVDAIKTAIKTFQPDIVIHCAGSADVRKSVLNPYADFHNNVIITHSLFFALHQCDLKNCKIIFLSSAGVYGNPIQLPISESMQPNPISPYALHKQICENICWYFINNYGMNIKIARIFSVYGNGLQKQIFWDMYCKAIKTKKLELYGTGNESRDYIHVTDVARAIYLIVKYAPQDEVIYNIANGEEVTIASVAQIFAEDMNLKGKVYFNGERREGDPINWCADISKLKNLGYKKTVNIEDGIRMYVRWATALK